MDHRLLLVLSSFYLFISYYPLGLYAQTPSLINDNDGFVNVRSTPNGVVIDSIFLGHIVWIVDSGARTSSKWLKVKYSNGRQCCKKNQEYQEGYVYYNRVKPLHSLKKNTGTLSKEGNPTEKIFPFEEIIFNIEYSILKNLSSNNCIWGIDDSTPQSLVKNIYALNGNKKNIKVDDCFLNISNFNIDKSYMVKHDSFFYIHMINSSGAGCYQVVVVFNYSDLYGIHFYSCEP